MKSWKHQQIEYDLYRAGSARALLWQMRTGKTKAVIDLATHLFNSLEINGVLVVAPNGVHRQWIDVELPKHNSVIPFSGFAYRLSDNPRNCDLFEYWLRGFKNVGDTMPWWLAVNMESLIREEVQHAIKRFKKRVGRALLVVDESHHFARPGAKRTAIARGLGRQFEYRRILTGTESENSPLQSFSQFEILEKEALGCRTFGQFKEKYAVFEHGFGPGGRRFPRLAGYKNLNDLKARKAKWASVVLRGDCEDLPLIQEDRRVVELTKKQAVVWRAVKKKEIETLEAMGRVTPLAGGAAFVKLQQIEGGFFKRDDGELETVVPPDDNPKFEALLDEIEQNQGQTLVWCQFVHEIETLHKWIRDNKISCGIFHGQRSIGERENYLHRFQNNQLRVLIGQPMAGGEGRDMSAASKVVWFSQTPDAIVRAQASERATKVGNASTQVVYFAAPGGVDDKYLRLTDAKTALAEDMARSGLQTLRELGI